MKQISTLILVYISLLIGCVFFLEIMATILSALFSIEKASDNMFPVTIGSLTGSLLACYYYVRKGFLTVNRTYLVISSKTYIFPVIVLGVSMFYIDEYLIFYLSKIIPPQLGSQEVNGTINIILQFFGVLLIAPFFEEIVFRGVLFKSILPKLGFLKASIIVSVIFGLLHFEPVAMPFMITGSILYCWVYMRTGNILLTMILHLINNSLTALLVYGNIESDLFFSISTLSQHLWFASAIVVFAFCLRNIYYQTKKRGYLEPV